MLHVRGLADVNVYGDHVNVGFFYGALPLDPAKMLKDTGKLGRYVAPRPDETVDAAHSDIEARLDRPSP